MSPKITKRNLWSFEETQTLIAIIEEKQCLQQIEEKLIHPNEIYTVIEKEMFARGFYDKHAKQIKFRWQNLRKMYYKDRKAVQEGIDGSYKMNPYYDGLHVVLGSRWSNKHKEDYTTILGDEARNFDMPVRTYEDTSQNSSDDEEEEREGIPKSDINDIGEMPSFEECFPSLPTSSKLRLSLKRPRTPDSTSRLDLFQAKIKQVTKELNDDLYKKQKELIEYEFRLFANYTTTRDDKFKEMMATNTQTFLSGIKDLLQEKIYETRTRAKSERNLSRGKGDCKQFFQTWDEDSEGQK